MDPAAPRSRRGRPRESGQASVELVAAIPVLLVGLALAVQAALVGYGAWSAGTAARAAARASYVGADPLNAARAALPGALRDRVEINADGDDGGAIEVALEVPTVIPKIGPIELSSSSQLGPADGLAPSGEPR